jgi:hypothetical protein
VDIKQIAIAAISSRNHKRLAILNKTDVADESSVENPINLSSIVNPAFMLADNPSSRGRLRHFRDAPENRQE